MHADVVGWEGVRQTGRGLKRSVTGPRRVGGSAVQFNCDDTHQQDNGRDKFRMGSGWGGTLSTNS